MVAYGLAPNETGNELSAPAATDCKARGEPETVATASPAVAVNVLAIPAVSDIVTVGMFILPVQSCLYIEMVDVLTNGLSVILNGFDLKL